MEGIKQKIRQSRRLAIIFSDLHLISVLSLACFLAFEKKWPGLISYHVHPAVLLVFWIIMIYLVSLIEIKKRDIFQVFFAIVLIILMLLFYGISLGPWVWMLVFVMPAVWLYSKDKKTD